MKAHSGSLGWLLYDASCSGLAKRISPRFEPLATSLSAGVPLIIVNEYVVHHRRWVGTCPIWRPDVPRWTSLILWRGLVIKGGIEVEVLNGISLHGGLCQSWPGSVYDTQRAMGAILEHWEQWGLPDYAQFDNDTRFQGPHQHADTIGRIIKMCLSLGVVPAFAPPREHGLQNAIESFNGRWQEKVWARFEHDSLEGLQRQSSCYIDASHARSAARIEAAPQRQELPAKWKFDPKKKVDGRLIYIRRTNDKGEVSVLGHQFGVDERWVHRLVRSEVDIDVRVIRFYALRRSVPDQQPMLRKVAYQLPLRYTPRLTRRCLHLSLIHLLGGME